MTTRKPITDEDLFFGELKMALRALVRAREMADQAPADTLMDNVWDAVADLENQTRKLMQASAAAAGETSWEN